MGGDTVLGLDIGTSGVKSLLVDIRGNIIGAASMPLTLQTPQPGWAEQDPESWWKASRVSIRRLLRRRGRRRVLAVGISGQQHSSVFLDARGAVIRPALLWCDGRTTAECREIETRVGGEQRLRDLVCNAALEGFTLPKILWLRRHEPQAFARLTTVLLAKDFIRFRLTGVLASEPSDASGTLLFSPKERRWSRGMLTAMGLAPTLMPQIGESAEVLGRLTKEAARLTGLEEGTPVVGGGGDNACGAVGVGAVAPGDTVASWGTSGTVLAPTAEPRVDPGLRAHTFCHALPGVWYVIGVVLSAGGAFAWFRDQVAREVPAKRRTDRLVAEAAKIPAGAEGVTFLPYLQGERTPHRDASLRGAFTGLSLAHTRGHLARAVLEGICFALKDSVEILRELGMAPDELLLTGGGAGSAFIRQLQADVFGVPVRTVNREEGPAYGAALLAAVGAGIFPDVGAAVRATLKRSAKTPPDLRTQRAYEEGYRRFHARKECA